MAFSSKYGPYSKGPVSAYTVNTGQPQAGPTAPQPYRPPTTQTIGGFGGQANLDAVQRLAEHLASGTNPGSGLPGSIPDPVTSGPGPTGTTPPGITPTSTPGPAPGSIEQQHGDEAAGMAAFQKNASLQAPINPSGLPSTLGQTYWVPNGSTIGEVTGYTRPQIGSGLFNGAAGEPDLPGYMGIGYVPPEYQPAAIAAALRAMTG